VDCKQIESEQISNVADHAAPSQRLILIDPLVSISSNTTMASAFGRQVAVVSCGPPEGRSLARDFRYLCNAKVKPLAR